MQHAGFINNEGAAREHTFAPGLLLQRKCECGQHTIAGRNCNACSKSAFSQPSAEATYPRTDILAGRDLSGVRAHSPAAARNIEANAPLRGFGNDFIHINGPDAGSGSGSATPPAPPRPAPGRTPATCPADINLDRVKQVDDTDFGKNGPITGWGGYARMEVSDPTGKDWAGTQIHEALTRVKNTCGDDGNVACSNTSGEGATRGSVFKVGQASKFLNFFDLPATKNSFYDLHVFKDGRKSLLHAANKQSCEIQCEQTYSCGGRKLGPTFLITYSMTPGSVPRRGGGSNSVTRVGLDKAAKP